MVPPRMRGSKEQPSPDAGSSRLGECPAVTGPAVWTPACAGVTEIGVISAEA
jgi:hypothetical protein